MRGSADDDRRLVSRLVQYGIDSLTSEEDARAVEAFFKDKECAGTLFWPGRRDR
jgi:hypothetical protein